MNYKKSKNTQTISTNNVKASIIFGLGNIHHLPFSYLRQRILNKALEIGFKAFDVAPAYGNGLNEKELGKLIKNSNFRPRIITKFGIPINLFGEKYGDFSYLVKVLKKLDYKNYGKEYNQRIFTPNEMKLSLENSLRRMNIDYVDDYLIHEPIEPIKDAELLKIIDMALKLKKEGKILRFGISGVNNSIKDLVDHSIIDSILTPINQVDLLKNNINKNIICFNIFKTYNSNINNEISFIDYVKKFLDRNISIVLTSKRISIIEKFRGLNI